MANQDAAASVKQESSNGIPDFATIHVSLTYDGYDTMNFWFRRSLGVKLRKLQQEFFGKTPTEQMEQQQHYRVMFLAELAVKHPDNVPGYVKGDSIEDSFKQFFSNEAMDDVVDHLWVGYQAKLYPKEIMSNLSS